MSLPSIMRLHGATGCSSHLHSPQAAATTLGGTPRSISSANSPRPLPHKAETLCSSSSSTGGARSRLVCCASSEAVLHDTTAPASTSSSTSSNSKAVPTSDTWEIDFCSRPLVDERGKKMWELLVCNPQRTFEYTEYFPNNRINSSELKRTFEKLLAQQGSQKPEKARFFRGQMQTIISKALNEINVKPVPSRRCFTVMSWLQERVDTVYKQDPRYSDKAQALFVLDLGAPEPLPDALRGEKWAFVQLPLGTLQGMLANVGEGDLFGSSFDLNTAGAAGLPSDILIPGVAVFSRRALPLAAWTNGLEIAGVKADVERSCLVLETGVNQRWRYGGWKPTEDSVGEAEGWEEAKKGVKGLHFLAVQQDPESEDLNGLWLLQDRPPPQI